LKPIEKTRKKLPTGEKKQITLEKIIKVAVPIFMQNRYLWTSMREIAARIAYSGEIDH